MSEAEVVQVAQAIADREGWPWIEPVVVVVERTFPLFGKRIWRLHTSARHGTRSVRVQIEEATRRVISVTYVPY